MMEISDLPDDVLGIKAYGKITQDDYKNILIPATEKKMAKHDKLKMFFHLGDMDGVEFSAMWEDTMYGIKHWSEFSHIALVTDNNFIKSMTVMFMPFFPGKVRLFSTADEDEAREWLGAK